MAIPKECKTAIYLRVSTLEQVDGFSLEGQEKTLLDDCKKRGRVVYKVYVDAGFSGTDTERQGLSRLLVDAKEEHFTEVLVWRVSRVARSLSYLLVVLEELKEHGVTLRSFKENFDANTPIGQFIINMTGAVAEMERLSWMESSQSASEERSRQGKWNGGTVLGYQSEVSPTGSSKLVVVLEEAKVIGEIFTCYQEGWGYKKIADYLNKQMYCGKTGKRFSVSTIRFILMNPVYAGFVRYKGVISLGEHEAIISKDIWQAVQEKIGQKSRQPKTNDRDYLLSGILCCPECGKGMTDRHFKKYRKDGTFHVNHYYSCSTYSNHGKNACHPNVVNADRAEKAVLDWLADAVQQPFLLKDIMETINARQQIVVDQHEDVATIERKVVTLDKKLQEYLQRYENDGISREDFLILNRKVKDEKMTLLSELEKASNGLPAEPMITVTLQDVKMLLKSVSKLVASASTERKKEILKTWIDKVVVTKEGKISTIELNFALNMTARTTIKAIL